MLSGPAVPLQSNASVGLQFRKLNIGPCMKTHRR